jgi:hypothetical protein
MAFAGKDIPARWARFPEGAVAFEWFEDFDRETTVDSTDTTAFGMAGDAISSGTGVMTTDEMCGVFRMANASTTDDSGYQIQSDMEIFGLQASKELRFMTRVRMSDATQSSMFTGIAITDTTIQHATTDTLAGGLTFTDGFGFYKGDASADVYGVLIRDSVQLAVGPLVAMVNDVYSRLAIKVEMTDTAGSGEVVFYVDGLEKGRIRSTTMPYATEEILAATAAWKAGAGANQTCDWDYLGVLVER